MTNENEEYFFTEYSPKSIRIDKVFKMLKDAKSIEERVNLDAFFCDKVFGSEENKIENKGNNINYTNIKKYLSENFYSNEGKEELNHIISNLESIYTYIYSDKYNGIFKDDYGSINGIGIKIKQFIDFLTLECIYIQNFNKLKNKYYEEEKHITDRFDELYKSIEVMDIEMKKTTETFIEKTKQDIYKDIIAIVGIFTAISFGVFGGMSLLNNLFSKLDDNNLNNVIIMGCISCICILTIIYIIVDYLGKLTEINKRDCNECKSGIGNFRKHHTALFYSYTFLSILLVLAVLYKILKN